MKAVSVFKDENGVTGTATFDDSASGLIIKAKFTELPAGEHGFHIHTNGDLRDEGCLGACAHFNKGPIRNHGGAPGFKGERHTGDLGNVSKTGHTYSYKLVGVSCSELLGRTLIIHADRDDLGLGGEEDSLTTGHSGKRIACSLIGRAKDCDAKKTRKIKH
jgi:Cu-Zn family superoxide dismutase